MFPSYRNQSVDLLCKSTDWFLYDGNIGRYSVKCLKIILRVFHLARKMMKSFIRDLTINIAFAANIMN